jgi:hypothetical protein
MAAGDPRAVPIFLSFHFSVRRKQTSGDVRDRLPGSMIPLAAAPRADLAEIAIPRIAKENVRILARNRVVTAMAGPDRTPACGTRKNPCHRRGGAVGCRSADWATVVRGRRRPQPTNHRMEPRPPSGRFPMVGRSGGPVHPGRSSDQHVRTQPIRDTRCRNRT